jgi:hypothetical protein
MSWLFSTKKQAPDFTSLQIQTSTASLPIPIVWGWAKIAVNVIWTENFHYNAGSSGGKGGIFNPQQTSPEYYSDVIMALCEGPIAAIGQIWRDQSIYGAAGLGLTSFNGTYPQTAWGYLSSNYPSQSLGYEGTAYLCAASYVLGSSASLGNHDVEIQALYNGTGSNGVDADPTLVIYDFLTNSNYGAGFAAASIDTNSLFGSGADASLQAYCFAQGIAISPALTSSEQGSSTLTRWLQIVNCGAVWSGGLLRFIPYGEVAISAGNVSTTVLATVQHRLPYGTAPGSSSTSSPVYPPPQVVVIGSAMFVGDGGVTYAQTGGALTKVFATPTSAGTYYVSSAGIYQFSNGDVGAEVAIKYTYTISRGYTPNLTPIYSLTDLDFVDAKDDADPIEVSRLDPFSLPNIMRLDVLSRNGQYSSTPIEVRDQSQIELYGPRVASSVSAHEICDDVGVAPVVAQTMLQRGLYVRRHFAFKLSWEYCLLDPMDIVEITDANLSLSALPVRLTSIEEDDNGILTVEAEELIFGVSTPALYPVAGNGGITVTKAAAADPVNTPLIFEPNSSLIGATPQIWIGASGGASGVADPNWGGCNVWLSVDGTSYSQIGSINTVTRQGVTTASLAAYSGASPDTANTLAVNLAESGGTLETASAAAAAAAATLSYVGGELLAYETPTLTGSNAYNITGLFRGLYGTTAAAHASGVQFARLDSAIFTYDIQKSAVGSTLYFKFESFNIYGSGAQLISACTAYPYVVTGAGFGTGAAGVPAAPTGLTATAGVGQVALAWAANAAGDNVTSYEVLAATGLGASIGSASVVWTGSARSWTQTGLFAATAYTYWVEAINAAGTSAPSASVGATVTGGGLDTTSPSIPTGLGLTTSLVTNADGTILSQLTAAWTAVSSQNLAYYDVEISTNGGAFISFQTASTSYTFTGLACGTPCVVTVRAISKGNYASGFSTVASLTTATKSTGPGNASNLSGAAAIKTIFLTWTNPSDTDLAGAQVWESATPSLASATLVATVNGSSYTYSGLTSNTTYYFWVRPFNTSGVLSAKYAPNNSTGVAVTTALMTNSEFAAGTINADMIQAGTIAGGQFITTTALPGTITVGSTGVSIGTLQTQAANPAAVINANTTTILPGLVTISGATTLSNWLAGGDNTKIDGGQIYTNSINTNSIKIGARGISTIGGIDFQANAATNVVSWSAGNIVYVNDAGTPTTVAISAGSCSSSAGYVYIYWVDGATSLSYVNNAYGSALAANCVLMATYIGAGNLQVLYGGTIIDGTRITTGTISSAQLVTGSAVITGTLQLGANIVTIPTSYYSSTVYNPTGSWTVYVVATLTFTLDMPGFVHIVFSAVENFSSNSNIATIVNLFLDGVVVNSLTTGAQSSPCVALMYSPGTIAAGPHLVQVTFSTESTNVSITKSSLLVLGVKR